MAEFEQIFDKNDFLENENIGGEPPTSEEQWDNCVTEFTGTPAFEALSDYERENISHIGWIFFREMEEHGYTVLPFNWTEEEVISIAKQGINTIIWDDEEEFNSFKTTTLAIMRFLVEEKQLLLKPSFLTDLSDMFESPECSYEEIQETQFYLKKIFIESKKMGIDLNLEPMRSPEVIEEIERKRAIFDRYTDLFEKYNKNEDAALAALDNDEERTIVMEEIIENLLIPEDEFSEKKMQQAISKMQRLVKKYRGNQDQAFAELSVEEQRYMVTYMTQEEDEDYRPQVPVVRSEPKIGRNDPCPCGSGKKYKKCHGNL
jgi:SEC-C motif